MASFKNIQWFPGHMAKTRREIRESLKNVDLVAEVLDARIPFSSSNPEIEDIICEKLRIVVLNKTDLADDFQTRQWIKYYESRKIPCVPFSLKNSKSSTLFTNKVLAVMSEKIKKQKSKGILNPSVRIMIVGIPNVGKSSVINKLCKNAKAKVENRPGVTRQNQWFSVNKNIQLLDTPGVLWPKFEDETTAYNLAFTGSIKDQILDIEDLAVQFLERVKNIYFNNLCERFKIDLPEVTESTSFELLKCIGKKRGMLVSGGEIDTLRTSQLILEEFRNAKIGKITLETPEISEKI